MRFAGLKCRREWSAILAAVQEFKGSDGVRQQVPKPEVWDFHQQTFHPCSILYRFGDQIELEIGCFFSSPSICSRFARTRSNGVFSKILIIVRGFQGTGYEFWTAMSKRPTRHRRYAVNALTRYWFPDRWSSQNGNGENLGRAAVPDTELSSSYRVSVSQFASTRRQT